METNMKIIMSIQSRIALISSPFLAPWWIGNPTGGNVFYMGHAGVVQWQSCCTSGSCEAWGKARAALSQLGKMALPHTLQYGGE